MAAILTVYARVDSYRPPRPFTGTYTSTTQMNYPSGKPIHALGISGNVILNSDTSLVRVIMTDVEGNKYLLYEAAPMLINGFVDTLTNVCEETDWLCGVQPASLNYVVKDATLNVTSLTTAIYDSTIHIRRAPMDQDAIRRSKVQAKVDKINDFLEEHRKYWRAGVTRRSLLLYNKKLGYTANDDDIDPFDYYAVGLLDIGTNGNINEARLMDMNSNPQFTDSFSWTNRHGINWSTDVRNQMLNDTTDSDCCMVFASVAALEAMIKLFLNKDIEVDLSERDLMINCPQYVGFLPNVRFLPTSIANYIKDSGICLEDDFKFRDDYEIVPKQRPDSSTLFYASDPQTRRLNYDYCTSNLVDTIKYTLINHGPIATGVYPDKQATGHAMLLLGYKIIHTGDTIATTGFHFVADEDLDGRLCWIFKNSYGEDFEYDLQGYRYIVFNDYNLIDGFLYFHPNFSHKNLSYLTKPSIEDWFTAIEDRDGDGYYTWGFKAEGRPHILPTWVPNEQDGDDDNPYLGPIDEYGNLRSVYTPSDTIYIDHDTEWVDFPYVRNPIVVKSGATFTISGTTNVVYGVEMFAGAEATINLNTPNFANVSIQSGEGTTINFLQNSRFNISHSNNNALNMRRILKEL